METVQEQGSLVTEDSKEVDCLPGASVFYMETVQEQGSLVTEDSKEVDCLPGASVDDDESWMRLDPPGFKRTVAVKKKSGQGKLLRLDKLLEDRIKMKRISAMLRQKVCESSDDDDDDEDPGELVKRRRVEQIVNAGCPVGDAESSMLLKWGANVFGSQKPVPDLATSDPEAGLIARIVTSAEDLGSGSSLKNMTSSGFLYSSALLEGRCNASTTRWLYHQMAYAKDLCLEQNACKVLCNLLEKKSRDGKPLCTFDWLPSAEDIKDTFHIYGYLDSCNENTLECEDSRIRDSQGDSGSPESIETSEYRRVPGNLRSVLHFLVPYFQVRELYPSLLSVPAAESLMIVFIRMLLDRQMLGVSDLLHRCLYAVVHWFKDEELFSGGDHLATTISSVGSTLGDNIRIVKCLHAKDARFGSLQKLVVLQLLSRQFNPQEELSGPEDVVKYFKTVNVKDKKFRFVNLYHFLVLADIYLWWESTVQKNTYFLSKWLEFLKKCSRQISTRDERPLALKVRNWASFLCQKYQFERMRTSTG